jgi:hypothetical protein
MASDKLNWKEVLPIVNLRTLHNSFKSVFYLIIEIRNNTIDIKTTVKKYTDRRSFEFFSINRCNFSIHFNEY